MRAWGQARGQEALSSSFSPNGCGLPHSPSPWVFPRALLLDSYPRPPQADLLEADKTQLRDELSSLKQADSWSKRTLVRPTNSIGLAAGALPSPKPATPVASRTPARSAVFAPATPTPATAAAPAAAVTPTPAAATDKKALQKTVEQAREIRDLTAKLQVWAMLLPL